MEGAGIPGSPPHNKDFKQFQAFGFEAVRLTHFLPFIRSHWGAWTPCPALLSLVTGPGVGCDVFIPERSL